MNTLFQEINWDADPIKNSNGEEDKYTLDELDLLCFTCPLADCKENSKKCPRNIAINSKA